MTGDILTFSPDDEVREVTRQLAEKNYSGAPVVDKDGKLIGVVTTSDLIYQKKNLHLPTVITLFDSPIALTGSHDVDNQMKKILGSTVADIMSDQVITIDEDTPLEDIATIMIEEGKHLLPVMREETQLVGVIDRSDIIRAIVKES